MRKRVGVITNDANLYNKIRLLLRAEADVEHLGADSASIGYDLTFRDLRSGGEPLPDEITVGDGGDISLPFRHEDLLDVFNSVEVSEDEVITLAEDGKRAYLGGEAIKLTGVEYSLLEYMLKGSGFVSKEDILRDVWGEGFDLGVVNVYIHYLRRKLEKNGKKVIISSRTEGYKIDERYRSKKL